MSDDLVKRLRVDAQCREMELAADRIEQLVATCEELEAKLAEVEEMKRLLAMDKINLRGELAGVQGKLAEWQAAQHYTYIGKDGKPVLAHDLEARAEAAEAALPAVYRLAAKNHAKWLRKQAGEKGGTKTPQGRTAQFYARKLGEQPTPTAAELITRINAPKPRSSDACDSCGYNVQKPCKTKADRQNCEFAP